MTTYQLMIKPVGPSCNLSCTYCYYLPKLRTLGNGASRMSDATLEVLTRQYIRSQESKLITFNWQGGEPTLAGLDFFRRAVELQNQYRRPGVAIENTLQTNGTLLDDQWCRFLHDNRFLVGLSVDGPPALHDLYRRDRKGLPTCGRAVQAARALRQHRVEFNTLTVINRSNARHPLQVYRFLRNVIGSRYMQLIPCVEPRGFESAPPPGREGGAPIIAGPAPPAGTAGPPVTDWSVDPEDYGSFMIALFDEWLQKDVGRIFVMNFEAALAAWLGLPAPACTFAERCGNALAVEHDGSVYSCDHYVYPEHRLGTIHCTELAAMVSSDRQIRFGKEKAEGLPARCRECKVLFACRGECPRNRFLRDNGGEIGLNYLCPGLRRFFDHIDPWMALMAREVRAGRSAENVMMVNPDSGGHATDARSAPRLDRRRG